MIGLCFTFYVIRHKKVGQIQNFGSPGPPFSAFICVVGSPDVDMPRDFGFLEESITPDKLVQEASRSEASPSEGNALTMIRTTPATSELGHSGRESSARGVELLPTVVRTAPNNSVANVQSSSIERWRVDRIKNLHGPGFKVGPSYEESFLNQCQSMKGLPPSGFHRLNSMQV